jgi:hypothetical protein
LEIIVKKGQKMRKCAFIRSDKQDAERRCPFGLPITEACHNAGSCVSNMCPLEMIPEDKKDRVLKANSRVYIYYKNGHRCLYSAGIMDQQKSVNCDFGDTGQGLHAPSFQGSPLYPQTFAGVGLDGLYAFPLGFYADNNESRNLFQGLFSLVGDRAFEIIKMAIFNNSEMKDIVEKLENGGELTSEEYSYVEDSLETCREKYDSNRADTSKYIELDNKWNSRKRL